MPNITWIKNGDLIERIGEIKSRAFTIRLQDLELTDAGNYTCIVCNAYGCINSTTVFTVQGKFNLFNSKFKYIIFNYF